MPSRVLLLVGTKKGGFVYTSDERRENWELSEPILPGWTFLHLAADLRGTTPRLYAAANHWAWGPSVAKSEDLGKTWDYRSEGLKFPPDMRSPSKHPMGEWNLTAPGAIGSIWNVAPGHASEPGVVYAGTQPAGLFRSEDWGRSWAPVESINRHDYRLYWSGTGGGDSCMHSIQVDPRDARGIYLCVGAGGSFKSTDGGATWDVFSHNAIPTHPAAVKLLAEAIGQFPSLLPPGKDPAGLDELHRMRLDTKNPDRLWGQAHWGVFRSDDRGATWVDVTEGLPSFHGFGIGVTKQGADGVFVVPLDYGADNFRVAPGQFAVYRTGDAGKTWERLTNGLPGPHNYQSVYREGIDTDGLRSEGVYVGTSNGAVYYGEDAGARWHRLPGTLPPVMSVTAAVV
ncbi:MAG: hypothetical protein HY875_08620 [Chloroflexi bacterium]|nr:hypothetical protein [Chloroflexota bacterium]